jgi:hypothetical protein
MSHDNEIIPAMKAKCAHESKVCMPMLVGVSVDIFGVCTFKKKIVALGALHSS